MKRTTAEQAKRLEQIEEDLALKFDDWKYKMPREIKTLFKKYWVTAFELDGFTRTAKAQEASSYCSIKSIL